MANNFHLPGVQAKVQATLAAKTAARLASTPFELWSKKKQKPQVMREQSHRCAICNSPDMWMGEPLKFHMDHIDGNNSNSFRSNLRCVCPNCHSQTETYCGKNKKLKRLAREASN